jgi:peptidoglycan/xylan/chitin deacetylase (PgdA/CDA1 family)
MTQIVITVDTELSALLHQRGMSADANFASSILGRCGDKDYGVGWQMDRLEAHGLKGVFFVDPMPTLLYGSDWLRRLVALIGPRGHEIQLHIHTEWLSWAPASPVGGRTGQNLADFPIDDQARLLEIARDLLVDAGAPSPTAFRAGNYGADDNSLRALARLGLRWDSSFNPAYLGQGCSVGLAPTQVTAIEHCGVIELPVAGLHDRPGRVRPAQICALSAREMREALMHAAANAHPAFVIVTHSFENLSRDRQRPNHLVMARFEAMCAAIAAHPALSSAGFADLDPAAILANVDTGAGRLPAKPMRTLSRIAQQALGTWRYERQLRPV